ncbi:6-phosphogluconolactonase [Dysgonomonas sp. 520]|uniref:6-phosphogluconolactonase n=1 Tax=Dysgonomonas sp. 520 TaxID=2302931 RepID=UPI0013D116D8|nr:6-phosphogluconolactonase [Dysgonomonas sp. 520]NDW10904.1 6-phosphogluconolactonase [Dysgonomonas sp. 520]
MNNETIYIYEDVQKLAEDFTSFLRRELKKRRELNLSLSGGSTPKALFNYWADNCKTGINWQKVRFYWGDERCVVPDDPMSNYGMTRDLLFSKVSAIDKNNIFRIHGENEAEDEAKRYSEILDENLPKKNNFPVFDIMMLGLGDDGHTVSIFPDHINFWDSHSNCIVARHPESKMYRISLSGKVVNNAENIVFLVTGKNKAEIVRNIIQQRAEYKEIYPAARVIPNYGNLYWFLDKEAASLL